MATQQHTGTGPYQCPDCSGRIVFEHKSWQCSECGHVPRHSAD